MTFGEFLRHPSTGPLLDSMLADNRRVDAAIIADAAEMDDAVAVPLDGPHQCCADCGVVEACDGETDTWSCWVCGRRWEAPCR